MPTSRLPQFRKLTFDVLEDRIVPAAYTVNTLSDLASQYTVPKTGQVLTSLRAAISLANADSDSTESIGFSVSGTIFLDASYGALPALASKTFTIDGTGITIDAGANSGIFVVNSDATAEIDNFALANTANAPAVVNDGNLTEDDENFSNGTACAEQINGPETISGNTYNNITSNTNGGALNITANTAISGCTFTGCQAGGGGGAVYDLSSQVTIRSSTFSGNSAAAMGGAIWNNAGSCAVNSTWIYANSAANGGGIASSGANSALPMGSGACIYLNTASAAGGGVYISGSSATANFTGSQIYSNTANLGGGIYNNGGALTVQGNAAIFQNIALISGGGLYNAAGTATFSSTSFTYNQATFRGGAIRLEAGTVTMTNGNRVAANTAAPGGGAGAYVSAGATLTDNSNQNNNVWLDAIVRE